MKERIDKLLSEKKIVSSRSQAKSMIENGDVTVDGVIIRKAGELINPESVIIIHSQQYVGRGALKLEEALKSFEVTIKEKILLDIGASTGGFTEVLLNHGAAKVYAIDVGHDQLALKIKNDPRVISLEGMNIKNVLTLPDIADGAVMDLSFISVTKVLDTIKTLLKPGGFLIVLVKPQFEAGKERLPKDGVIKDKKLQEEILNEVLTFASKAGWKVLKTIDSPIEGKSGNREFLSLFSKV